MSDTSPAPAAIRELRAKAKLTQAEAAKLIHCQERIWRWWENGGMKMPLASWELFRIKAECLIEASA